MSKSEQHLRDAFAGESQANRKYLAFAEKAAKDGYPQIAKLFRAAGDDRGRQSRGQQNGGAKLCLRKRGGKGPRKIVSERSEQPLQPRGG